MDKKAFFAIGLCIAIFLLWIFVIVPRLYPSPTPPAPEGNPPTVGAPEKSGDPPLEKPPEKAPEKPAPKPQEKPAEKPPEKPAVKPAEPEPLPDQPLETAEALRNEVLQSEFLKVEFTNVGAGIRRLELHYPDQKSEISLLKAFEERWPHMAMLHVGGPDPIERLPWKLEEKTETSIRYSYLLRNRVRISKEFRLLPEKRQIKLMIWLKNEGKASGPDGTPPERELSLALLAFNGMEHETRFRYDFYSKGVAFHEDRLEYRTIEGVKEGQEDRALSKELGSSDEARKLAQGADEETDLTISSVEWIGLKNRFFASILKPDSASRRYVKRFRYSYAPKEARERAGNLEHLYLSARFQDISVGAQDVPIEFTAFVVPIKKDVLLAELQSPALLDYSRGCGCINLFGLIDAVGPIILSILKWFAGLSGNWGVAIILTTLMIRICLFPLTKKGQVSMYRMQELGPKIKVLRERYKDDQQKFGQEQMRLFREHKINPLGGCLPLLLQLPIFISMFGVFEMSIELRNQHFMFWVTDLAQPDALIPFQEEYLGFESFNLLPLLMGAVWFLQSWFAPRSPDPQMAMQQKMMLFMPLVFCYICYDYASGLSLYFLVNSLLALGEQKFIKKVFLKPREEGAKV